MNSLLISFNIAAIPVCIACLVSTLLRRKTAKAQNKFFIALLVIIGMGALSGTVSASLQPLTRDTLSLGYAANYVYFIFHTALAPVFFYYMACVAGRVRRYSVKMHLAFILPFAICELLVLSNPITGWTFTFDEMLIYHRGWVVYAMYALGIVYMIVSVAVVCLTWNAITPFKRNSLLFYVVLVVFGVLIQMLVPALKVEVFAESLAMMGLLITIENEDDRMDFDTGVYGRRALLLDFERYISAGTPFHAVCVRMTNIDFIVRAMGQKNYEMLVREIAGWLKGLAPWYRIYRISFSSFVLVNFKSDPSDAEGWARAIQERFLRPWKALDTDVSVRAVVMRGTFPDDFASGEEVLAMADAPLPIGAEEKILSGRDLVYLKRRSQVEHAVGRGLEEGNFELYYQPICLADGTVCAAEALMRLHDPELGDVPPDEFIEVAEQSGTIDRIGAFALEEACRFVASGQPGDVGVGRIHVNLSVVQCLDPDFARFVISTVEGNGVSPSQIGFEITESVAAADEGVVSEVMDALSAKGFSFGMDDYGTGYASMHYIFSHDFGSIKVDKSILWDAGKDGNSKTALEYTMRMIHETGRKAVVEGVESAEHVALLRSLDADFLQGFYYSKPLPEKEFVAKVKELQEAAG